MRITKISPKQGLIALSIMAVFENENTSYEKEQTEKSSLVPHPDLNDSIAKFKIHLLRVIYREFLGDKPADTFSKDPVFARMYEAISISNISFKGSGALSGIIIEGTLKSLDGGTCTLKTSKIRYDETSSYKFAKELNEDIGLLLEEAEMYQTGEKFDIESLPMDDQPTIFDENNAPKENEEVERLLNS